VLALEADVAAELAELAAFVSDVAALVAAVWADSAKSCTLSVSTSPAMPACWVHSVDIICSSSQECRRNIQLDLILRLDSRLPLNTVGPMSLCAGLLARTGRCG
jgi:hypothetical protein